MPPRIRRNIAAHKQFGQDYKFTTEIWKLFNFTPGKQSSSAPSLRPDLPNRALTALSTRGSAPPAQLPRITPWQQSTPPADRNPGSARRDLPRNWQLTYPRHDNRIIPGSDSAGSPTRRAVGVERGQAGPDLGARSSRGGWRCRLGKGRQDLVVKVCACCKTDYDALGLPIPPPLLT